MDDSRTLKKALLHPPYPRRAETRLFPVFVLASLRGSTYYRGCGFRPIAWCGRARERHVLACSGWAGEKSGFFEHPIVYAGVSLTSALFLKNLLGVGR
jgi:hypothetical protein